MAGGRIAAGLSPSRGTAAVVLATLVAGAAYLRASGIDYLVPEVMNRDGLVVVRQIEMYRGRAAAEAGTWWYTSYPHLMARIGALLPEKTAPPGVALGLEEHLALARAPWVSLRWISIVFSLLAIPGSYLLARRFLDRAGSLFAAGLTATSLHHVCLSIQEKPHAAAASFILLALVAALRLRRKPDGLAWCVSGVATALALGTLHSAVIVLPALAAALVLRDRKRATAWPWVVLAAATIFLSAWLFYPFFFRGGAPAGSAAQADPGVAGDPPVLRFSAALLGEMRGAPVGRILRALWGLDPLLFTASALGILIFSIGALRDRGRLRSAARGDLAVVLAMVVPYLAVLFLYRNTLVRFFLPLGPIFACAAGLAFSRVVARMSAFLPARAAREASGALFAAALLAVPLVPAWHFARVRCQPGPLDEAAQWVETHVDRNDVVAVVPYYDLPLFPTAETLEENARRPYRTIWSTYLARVPPESLLGPRRPILVEPGDRPRSRRELDADALGYFRRFGVRWVVFDLSGGGAQLMQGKADLVKRISPWRDESAKGRGVVLFGTGYDPLAPSAASILRLRTLGTAIEIFRVP